MRAGTGDRLTSLRYPEGGEGAVVATFTRARQGERGGGPLQRLNVWLDPGTGQVLDAAGSNSGLIRVFHVLHGSLMVPGWGRTIVGWVGVFMFISCLTGIWLWWPIGGSFRRGFRWKRQNSTNANIHHRRRLLDLAAARHAEFYRLLDLLPRRVRRWPLGPAPRAGAAARRDAGSAPTPRSPPRSRSPAMPASPASPGRPTARRSGNLPSSAPARSG